MKEKGWVQRSGERRAGCLCSEALGSRAGGGEVSEGKVSRAGDGAGPENSAPVSASTTMAGACPFAPSARVSEDAVG